MKTKKFFLAALTMMCAMTTTVMTACSSSDDDGGKTSSNDPVAATMDYVLTTSNEMLDILDVTIEYYDENGKVQTEKMTNPEWKKTVRAKLPATLGARMKGQLKDGVDVTTIASFKASYGYSYMGYAVNANNQAVGAVQSNSSSSNLTMKGEKIPEFLNDKKAGIVKFLFTFDTKGNSTSASWQ